MKLRDLLTEVNFRNLLEDMLEPESKKPPNEKGSDAIRVEGYFVRGHWRRRWHPGHQLKLVPEKQRRQWRHQK